MKQIDLRDCNPLPDVEVSTLYLPPGSPDPAQAHVALVHGGDDLHEIRSVYRGRVDEQARALVERGEFRAHDTLYDVFPFKEGGLQVALQRHGADEREAQALLPHLAAAREFILFRLRSDLERKSETRKAKLRDELGQLERSPHVDAELRRQLRSALETEEHRDLDAQALADLEWYKVQIQLNWRDHSHEDAMDGHVPYHQDRLGADLNRFSQVVQLNAPDRDKPNGVLVLRERRSRFSQSPPTGEAYRIPYGNGCFSAIYDNAFMEHEVVDIPHGDDEDGRRIVRCFLAMQWRREAPVVADLRSPVAREVSRRRRFYDPRRFPELQAPLAHWKAIRDEALDVTSGPLWERLRVLGGLTPIVFPLMPEPTDSSAVHDPLFADAREAAPLTTRLVTSIPYVIAFAFARLRPGEVIPMHEHESPRLIALLCLQTGGDSHIVVGGERRDFEDGQLMVFDYTHTHETFNHGTEDRVALLMTIEARAARAHREAQAARSLAQEPARRPGANE